MKNCYHKLVKKCVSIVLIVIIILGFIVTPALFVADAFNYDKSIKYVNWDTEIKRPYIVEEVIGEDTSPQKVQTSNTVRTIAQIKLNDLVKTHYWSHTNSNGCNFHCRVSNSLVAQGGRYTWIGENLYRGICDINNAYRLWRLSPLHNEVLQHRADEQVLLQSEFSKGVCYYVLIKATVK